MIINGEMAAKPRFYFRNDLLHVRYNVDRAVELTKEEKEELIAKIESGADKHETLKELWKRLIDTEKRPLIKDGIKCAIEKYGAGENFGKKFENSDFKN